MIDINKLRQSLVAVQPEEVGELLDRLEAAEKAVTEAYQRGYETGQEEIAAERDTLRTAVRHESDCVEAAKTEIDALRAKVAETEEQEPVALVESWANGSYSRNYKLRWLRDVNEGARLYALPGAQPAPSVPEGWQLVPTAESRHPGIYKMLGALHAADNTPGMSEWESYRAMLSEAPEAKPCP